MFPETFKNQLLDVCIYCVILLLPKCYQLLMLWSIGVTIHCSCCFYYEMFLVLGHWSLTASSSIYYLLFIIELLVLLLLLLFVRSPSCTGQNLHFHHIFFVHFSPSSFQSPTWACYPTGRSHRNPSVGLGTGRTSAVQGPKDDDVVLLMEEILHLFHR